MREYNTPHDLAIKAANWAMKENPDCQKAFQKMWRAKKDLESANRNEIRNCRAVFMDAKVEWIAITSQTFDLVMASAGFPQ